MKSRIACSLFLSVTLAAAPAFAATRAAQSLSCSELSAISAAPASGLGQMRAGAARRDVGFTGAELSSLRQAAVEAPQLGELRAGDLTNREWTIVGVVLLAVLVVVAIA